MMYLDMTAKNLATRLCMIGYHSWNFLLDLSCVVMCVCNMVESSEWVSLCSCLCNFFYVSTVMLSDCHA